MKPEFRNALLGVGVIIAFALVSAVSALLGARGCKGDPVQILPVGIDAGPGDLEIASRLDGAVQGDRGHAGPGAEGLRSGPRARPRPARGVVQGPDR